MAVDPCESCAAPLGTGPKRVCKRCGWDARVGLRRCVKCEGVVSLFDAIGYGPVGGVIGIGGFFIWRLFGLLLGGAVVCAVGSCCGLWSALRMAQACGQCRYRPAFGQLLPQERKTLRLRRLGFLIGGVVLGAGAVVLFSIFAAIVS